MTMPQSIKQNWKSWANGTISAIITGAVSVVGVAAIDPDHFGFATGDYTKMLKVMAGGAFVGLINHLRTSPFPDLFGDDQPPTPATPPATTEEPKQ